MSSVFPSKKLEERLLNMTLRNTDGCYVWQGTKRTKFGYGGTKEHILDAAETIISSFEFVETEEGYDYWDDVYYALHRIAKEGR